MCKGPYHLFPGTGAKAGEKEQGLSVPWHTIFRQVPQLREELESGVPTWAAGGSQYLKPYVSGEQTACNQHVLFKTGVFKGYFQTNLFPLCL